MAISKGNVENIYALTPMQLGMLYFNILDEHSTGYVLQHVLRIDTELNDEKIKQSLSLLSDKYDILRTTIVIPKTSAKPRQVVLKEREIEMHSINLSGYNQQDKSDELARIKTEDVARGFNLEKDSLLRVTLINFEDESIVIWSAHHIIMDGWCFPILLRDFMKNYQQLTTGISYEQLKKTVSKDKKDIMPFSEYVKWIERQNEEIGLKYWRKLLKDYSQMAEITSMGIGTESQKQVESVYKRLSAETSGRLQKVSSANNVTVSTLLEAAWGILLQRYNRTNDVVFGKVVSGRNADIAGIEKAVGLFINTIPVRVKSDKEMTVLELLEEQQEQSISSESYDYCGLAQVQQQSNLDGELFDTIFAYENYYIDSSEKDEMYGVTVKVESIREQTNYSLSVKAYTADVVSLEIMYDPREFSKMEVESIIDKYATLLEHMSQDLNRKIVEIDIVPESEKEKILKDFNDTAKQYPKDKTIIELFEEQIEKRKDPSEIAVICEENTISYEMLNKKANQLARKLRELGVGPDDFVVLFAQRNIEMIIGIYGILKAGGAYVPIDPEYPQSRIEFMVNDSMPKAIITVDATLPFETDIPVIDIYDETIYTLDDANLERINKPEDLIYCLYTSGTTGNPKGVIIENRGLVAYNDYLAMMYNAVDEDIMLQFSNSIFDVSIMEIFTSILNGIKLCIAPKDVISNRDKFKKYIQDNKITILLLPPQYYLLSDINDVESIRLIMSGGSPSNYEIVKSAVQIGDYINLYGPTETTVASTGWKYSKGSPIPGRIPIGKPIYNTQTYIVNEGELCGIGMPGELCIAGDGLARGYLNRADLTAEKFVENPYGEGRLYLTGDLARWMPDGNIDYLGRIDEQVKIRGYRIELGEIEGAIRLYNGVLDVAVIAVEDTEGDQYISAYIVSDKQINTTILREELSGNLPDYMIPARFMQLDSLPLTPNGKLDKKALPKIESKRSKEYKAPANDVEKALVQVFEDVLSIFKISVNDDFFELGGDSIKAISIITRLNQMGYKISLKEIFQWRNIETIAKQQKIKEDIVRQIEKNKNVIRQTVTDVKDEMKREKAKLVSQEDIIRDIDKQIQKYSKRIMSNSIIKTSPLSSSQIVSFKMGIIGSYGKIECRKMWDSKKFAKTWLKLINEYGVLKSKIIYTQDEKIMQEYACDSVEHIPFVDLSYHEEIKKEKIVNAITGHIECYSQVERYRGNDITNRVLCIKLSEMEFIVLIPISHLVFDGFSNEVLSSRFDELYEQGNDQPEDLKEYPYSDYVKMLEKGPRDTTEGEIIEFLELEKFSKSIDDYQNAKRQKEISNIKYEVKLSDKYLNVESKFALAEKIFNNALKYTFDDIQMPLLIVHSGRNYSHNNFSNYIGEFVDFLPIVVDTKKENKIFERVQECIRFVREHDVNIINFFENEKLSAQYRDISKIIGKIQMNNLNAQVLNLLIMYQAPMVSEIEKTDEDIVRTDSQMNNNNAFINVMQIDDKLVFDNLECIKGQEENMKKYLDNLVD